MEEIPTQNNQHSNWSRQNRFHNLNAKEQTNNITKRLVKWKRQSEKSSITLKRKRVIRQKQIQPNDKYVTKLDFSRTLKLPIGKKSN